MAEPPLSAAVTPLRYHVFEVSELGFELDTVVGDPGFEPRVSRPRNRGEDRSAFALRGVCARAERLPRSSPDTSEA